MCGLLRRSTKEPYRAGLSYAEIWHGPDKSLIRCWEIGRQLRDKEPEIAALATKGELVSLHWKGGTGSCKKLPPGKKPPVGHGTLRYLATWQGLRGEDLEIEMDSKITLVCTRTRRPVIFDLITAACLDP
jgi:hypothetical protein